MLSMENAFASFRERDGHNAGDVGLGGVPPLIDQQYARCPMNEIGTFCALYESSRFATAGEASRNRDAHASQKGTTLKEAVR
jgi:hypothetical protein